MIPRAPEGSTVVGASWYTSASLQTLLGQYTVIIYVNWSHVSGREEFKLEGQKMDVLKRHTLFL